jgi:putative Ca2+/H+ antiporter (TMEM165/GDT1 family)
MLKAFMLIFVAEMGDKTQILAMAFATKYPVKKVLLGIFIGAFLNHGLAVLFGSYLSQIIPISSLQIIAGFAFVGFALWTLYSDDEEEEETKKYKLGPIFTVSLAFFLGELGDKTQLTAITLAAESTYPAFILLGTVLGMIVTGGIGIFVGKTVGKKIPEYVIKIAAASVFMLFGVIKLFQTIPSQLLTPINITLFFLLISTVTYSLLRNDYKRRQSGIQSELKSKAESLYNFYHKMDKTIGNICLGKKYCGECEGENCIIGYIKKLIKNGINNNSESSENDVPDIHSLKSFDRKKLLDALIFTIEFKQENPSFTESNIDRIQKNIEIILFGRNRNKTNDLKEYLEQLKTNHQDL